MKKSNWVTIKTFLTRTEADIASRYLASSCIRSLITADDVGRMNPFPFSNKIGVELKVSARDFKKAKECLVKAVR